MERFLMIKEQLPMRERSYTDQQGQQKVFVSVGFVLTDGINTMFAEAVGDMARAGCGRYGQGAGTAEARPGSDAPRGI